MSKEDLKILVVTPEIPFPYDHSGFTLTMGKLIVEWLNAGHQIDILNYGSLNEGGESHFSGLGCNVLNDCRLESNINLFSKLYSLMIKPRNMLGFESGDFKSIFSSKYDLTVFSRFESAMYINNITIDCGKKVFFEIDALSLYYKRSAQQEKNFFNKIYYLFQESKVASIERKSFEQFDKLVFLSIDDLNYMNFRYHKSNCFSIRNGVDFFEGEAKDKENNCNRLVVAFSGDFKYKPNAQAADFIIKEIIPEMISRDIKVVFKLVGRNPTDLMLSSSLVYTDFLIVTGNVQCVEFELSDSDIYISPLFVGSGIKNKILNVMKLGIPFVATKVSVEGIIELQADGNYLECNSASAKDWVTAILHLSENKSLCKKIISENIVTIKNNYQWPAIAKEFLLKVFK